MTRPCGRFVRRVTALVVAIGFLALSAAPPATARSGRPLRSGQVAADRSSTSGTGNRPTIRLVHQDAVVDPDGDVSIYLEVDGAPDGSDLAIDIYPVIDDEERLDEALEGELRNSAATFPVVPLPGDTGTDPVQTAFVINLWSPGQPAEPGGWAKRLDDAGVYPLRVRLRGPDSATLETLVTFVVRGPDDDDEVDSIPVALVPIVTSGSTPEELLAAPDAPLAPELLNAIDAMVETFAAHPGIPASFVVPAEVARRLSGTPDDAGSAGGSGSDGATGGTDGTDGETDGTDATDATDGTDDGGATGDGASGDDDGTTTTSRPAGASPDDVDPDAARVLTRLREVLADAQRELLASPYVDIDPAELVRNDLVDELTRQHQLGFRDLADALEPPAGGTWPVRHPLDADTVDVLSDIGIDDLLVPPASLAGDAPALPARLAGATERSRAIVLDPALAAGDSTDPALDAQRLYAHAIARGVIDQGAPQLVAVPLPESVEDVAQLDALLALLDTDRTFLAPGTVTDLMRSARSAPGRATLTAPDDVASGDYPAELRDVRHLTTAFASMVPDHPDLVAQVTEPLSRSAAAGLSADVRTAFVQEIRADVEARFAEVTIPPSDRVTLGARDAQFPLVVSSGSDVPLRVIVQLESASDRLTVKQSRIEVLLDGDRTVVPVRVHSRSPGDTPIRITVSTLDGQVILSEGTYSVRSTAVSGVGLLLTVGAGLFLALWWGRHFVRARRTRARHAR